MFFGRNRSRKDAVQSDASRMDARQGDASNMGARQSRSWQSADESAMSQGTTAFSSRLFGGEGPQRPRKKNALSRAIEAWTTRLLGAARSDTSFSDQEEEYDSNRTSQDYLWNSIGLAAWGMVFPMLTIVATWLVGVERAGMFSFAFVVANLLMILANYGARTYQVSDRQQTHSFIDYQVSRWITVLLMLLVGYLFCQWHGYAGEMFTMTMWLFIYRAVDGLADCYEGRLQQVDKLYLAGISQTVRSVVAFLAFALFLLITRNLGIAAIAMGVLAIVSFIFVTFPLTLLETPRSKRFSLRSVLKIFTQCFPAFVALFMYAVVDNMPKFMMDGVLSYDNQLYFNALYFPAMAILIIVGFCYKPMLTRMADAWNDLERRRRFDLLIIVALLAVALITGVVLLAMATIGLPIMSFMYGLDFEQFRHTAYLMVLAGGITGGIDFLYQVFTVMRRQGAVTKLYVITFAFSIAICYMLIHVSALRGAVMSYLIIMSILLVLLVLEYVRIRVEYKKHPEDDPTYLAAKARANEGATRTDDVSADDHIDDSEQNVRRPIEFTAREAARQERIIRQGGEPDPRYRAWRSLQRRRKNRD